MSTDVGRLAGGRALVTGAGGFIGSHLVESLVERGVDTRALVSYRSTGAAGWLDQSPVRPQIEVVVGDLRDRDLVDKAVSGCSVVFHLGALIAIPYSYRAPISYVQTNVEGTLNVLLACRDAGVERLVHTSTSEVYGSARTVPIREDHPLQAQSPYAASKIAADKMVEAFHCSFSLPVVTVRPFNTYGPRQSARAIIPTVIAQALSGQTLKLGNTSPTRDFNFVLDTVAGFIAAAGSTQAVGHTINLATGREISISDMAHLVARLCGASISVEVDDRRVRPAGSEVERLCGDGGKAAALLGWQPTVALEEGLSRTIAWMRDHLGIFRPTEYSI